MSRVSSNFTAHGRSGLKGARGKLYAEDPLTLTHISLKSNPRAAVCKENTVGASLVAEVVVAMLSAETNRFENQTVGAQLISLCSFHLPLNNGGKHCVAFGFPTDPELGDHLLGP